MQDNLHCSLRLICDEIKIICKMTLEGSFKGTICKLLKIQPKVPRNETLVKLYRAILSEMKRKNEYF